MRAVELITKKRDGGELSAAELGCFVQAAAHGHWPDYQLSAMLMAIYWRGMTPAETAEFTRAMVDSGKRLSLDHLPGVHVDKHSTGGVGDKVSLVVAPLAAACGASVPMMSGRGLGHTGGTLDKLEAIPGFRVHLSEPEFFDILQRVGCVMLGQTAEVAPADKKLYALRDVTGTVECLPLITASILSKKIAEGISCLVLDVKCGSGSFNPTLVQARALAETIQRVGTANGLKVRTYITDMESPLGNAVGNSLEVIEAIDTLRGRGPVDFTELCVVQAGAMVELAGLASNAVGARAMVQQALSSGAALAKFRQMVQVQGGDPAIVDDSGKLPQAPERAAVLAKSAGYIATQNARMIGLAAMKLGAGRATAEDRVVPSVGVVLHKKPGERVRVGEVIYEVHHDDRAEVAQAIAELERSYSITDDPPELPKLILEVLA